MKQIDIRKKLEAIGMSIESLSLGDFDQIGESSEKKYSLQLMESFILLDHQK